AGAPSSGAMGVRASIARRRGVTRARGLTAEQRTAYHQLRALALATLESYPQYFTQGMLADAVGVHQTIIGPVLKGNVMSMVTLEKTLRVMMRAVSVDARRHVRAELARLLPLLRDHRPRPPRAGR